MIADRTPTDIVRAAVTCIAAVLAAAALSACGSSSGATASAATGGSATSSSARYQARLNLAKCLRAHGVNAPDPSAGGGPAGGGGGPGALASSPNFQAAIQACAKYRSQAFGFRNISPTQRAQFQQALVKFAQCMRSRNINIPDPSTSAGGGFGIFRQITPSERNSPAFQTAFRQCSTNLPFRGGGPGGPPGA